MAELKTRKNDGDVDAFLNSIEDETKRSDSFKIKDLMERLSGDQARMWGSSIVGFGERTYTRADGKGADWFKIGFSPRKQNLTLYIMDGFDSYESHLENLGKHSTGKACLYIKRLDQVDMGVLETLVTDSLKAIDSTTGA